MTAIVAAMPIYDSTSTMPIAGRKKGLTGFYIHPGLPPGGKHCTRTADFDAKPSATALRALFPLTAFYLPLPPTP